MPCPAIKTMKCHKDIFLENLLIITYIHSNEQMEIEKFLKHFMDYHFNQNLFINAKKHIKYK